MTIGPGTICLSDGGSGVSTVSITRAISFPSLSNFSVVLTVFMLASKRPGPPNHHHVFPAAPELAFLSDENLALI